jgi:hypothetical protein
MDCVHAFPTNDTDSALSFRKYCGKASVVTLWKDADIPILKQAKAEYAKLQ